MKAKSTATGGKGGIRSNATGKQDYTALNKVRGTRGPAAKTATRKYKAAQGAEGPKKSSTRKVTKTVAKRLSDGRKMGR
jgi:hypothetical protein